MPTLSESQRNPWIWVSSPTMPRKLHVDDCSRKPKYTLSFSTAKKVHGVLSTKTVTSSFDRDYLLVLQI